MTPQSVLSLIGDNKKSIETFVSHFADELESGNLDALKTYFLCKSWEVAIEKIKEIVKKEALYEASKYGKGEHTKWDFKFSLTGTGGKPDYKVCEDPVLNSYMEQVKEREAFLKSLKAPLDVADENTGEVLYTIKPLAKLSGETLKVSIL